MLSGRVNRYGPSGTYHDIEPVVLRSFLVTSNESLLKDTHGLFTCLLKIGTKFDKLAIKP